MDVYGYPAYQYSNNDELAKQMFAQQALASSMPYNRGIPEPHNMPAPSGSPWNSQGLPWGLQSPPQLVQFTGAPMEQKMSPVIHTKRKSLDVEPVIPAKQLITEEKIAAHFNSLYISKDFTPHRSDNFMEMAVEDLPSTSIDKLKGHTIVLSDEVKRLQEEPLLPAALIERLEKPHMSLVVWKPREDILGKLKEENEQEKKEEEIANEAAPKRNGVLVSELPEMDVEM